MDFKTPLKRRAAPPGRKKKHGTDHDKLEVPRTSEPCKKNLGCRKSMKIEGVPKNYIYAISYSASYYFSFPKSHGARFLRHLGVPLGFPLHHPTLTSQSQSKAQELQFIISVAALGAPQALQCLGPDVCRGSGFLSSKGWAKWQRLKLGI